MRILPMKVLIVLSDMLMVPPHNQGRSQKPELERVCWFKSSPGHQVKSSIKSNTFKRLGLTDSFVFRSNFKALNCVKTHIKHQKSTVFEDAGTTLAPKSRAGFNTHLFDGGKTWNVCGKKLKSK